MSLNLLLAILTALTFVAFFCVLAALAIRSARIRHRVQADDLASPREASTHRPLTSWLEPLGRTVPRSDEERSREQKRLAMAGFRRKNALAVFYGVRILVALMALAVMLAVARDNLLLLIVLPVLLGAMLPDIWLKHRIARRQLAIQLGLPDMTDLAVICVEAGMGMDQAFSRISKVIGQSHAALSEELRLYILQVNAGQSRARALRNLGERTGVDDMKALTVSLIQADRFGTEVGQSLRTFADGLRTKRRQRAEEHAAKMGVKLLFPLMLFIFPAIVIVVAGPAIITIINELLPGLQAGGR